MKSILLAVPSLIVPGLAMLASVAALTPAAQSATRASGGHISKKSFGKASDGHPVSIYTLTNAHGMEARITNYGGIVVSLKVPDRNGKFSDVVLGYNTVAEYIKNSPYFGALIGRYGNRIAGGKFTLDGKTHKLFVNNGPNSLHGGKKGFDKVVWHAGEVHSASGVGLALSYLSKDGEEGYPGNLKVRVVYTLTNRNELKIAYTATTDKDTVLNLTNHSYFNLKGAGNGDVMDHVMMINADNITPVNKTLIPTGKLEPVQGTPFDFRTPHTIGSRIHDKDQQLTYGNGYDHNFVINRKGAGRALAARVYEPTSGRVLTVTTTQPGVQFYTGNFLDGTNVGKGNKAYKFRYAFCLETQHFPDSPNQPNFPTSELRPGQTYRQTTAYKFSTR